MSPRWALFLSGRGSTAQALLDLMPEIEVACVVSSKISAPGVNRARRLGVPTMVLPKQIIWNELSKELKARRITHLFLVGFMRLLPAEFVSEWSGRIWNVHPSLLPAYAGKDALIRSYNDGAKLGVTVHEVIAEMDAGPLCRQAEVARAETLSETELEVARVEQRLLREWALRLRAQSEVA